MCDAPTDDADAPRVSPDGSQLVHVDCERCRSRLEVRVPLAFQLAGRDATVRCGACETLLQVAVPPSPRSTPAPASASQDSRAMHAAAAAFLRHHPVEDDHSGPTTAPSDAEHCAGMPPRSHDEQRRHMQLAQWHMNMAQRHSPPLGSLDVESFFPYAPPPSAMPPTRDHVDQLLRQAAHDFWSAPSETANAADAARPKKLPRRERKPREPSPYNVFIREEIPRLKQKDPSLNHREAFKAAARNWAHSPLNLRSAAYAPAANAEPSSSTDGANRNVRLEIMAKLHPHLLRSRREDLVVRDDDEDKRTANAKKAKTAVPASDGEETRSPDAAAAEEAETSMRRNEKERADAVEAAARVVDALVEAATRRSTRHGGCVSSDKSTDGHAAWDGEWRRVDVPE